MENTTIEWLSMSDKSIIATVVEYIKHQRLIQNKTQATIAKIAGINRWTLSKVENGDPISLTSLIQILRALNLLEVLNIFKIESQISPLKLAKLEKQKRQRASTAPETENQHKSKW